MIPSKNMNEMVKTNTSKNSIIKYKEKKITHVYLNDKYLKKIPKFARGHNILVIYLHNNEIHEISNLHNTPNLTNLYLQNNMILKIENLRHLQNLRKLYLGHNTISVVEGIETLQNLQELHLEKQYLYEGNALCFDPRSIHALSDSLQVLNVSHNKMQTISTLAPLKFLKVFNASHNDLSDIKEICDVIKNWIFLKDLNLAHNPIGKSRLYKEELIANVYNLEILDEKAVTDHTRKFLKRLHKQRTAHRLHKNINLADGITGVPKNYSSAIQKAISISVLKESKKLFDDNTDIFDEKNAIYIPWKTLSKQHSVPRLNMISANQTKQVGRMSQTQNTYSQLKL